METESSSAVAQLEHLLHWLEIPAAFLVGSLADRTNDQTEIEEAVDAAARDEYGELWKDKFDAEVLKNNAATRGEADATKGFLVTAGLLAVVMALNIGKTLPALLKEFSSDADDRNPSRIHQFRKVGQQAASDLNGAIRGVTAMATRARATARARAVGVNTGTHAAEMMPNVPSPSKREQTPPPAPPSLHEGSPTLERGNYYYDNDHYYDRFKAEEEEEAQWIAEAQRIEAQRIAEAQRRAEEQQAVRKWREDEDNILRKYYLNGASNQIWSAPAPDAAKRTARENALMGKNAERVNKHIQWITSQQTQGEHISEYSMEVANRKARQEAAKAKAKAEAEKRIKDMIPDLNAEISKGQEADMRKVKELRDEIQRYTAMLKR